MGLFYIPKFQQSLRTHMSMSLCWPYYFYRNLSINYSKHGFYDRQETLLSLFILRFNFGLNLFRIYKPRTELIV